MVWNWMAVECVWTTPSPNDRTHPLPGYTWDALPGQTERGTVETAETVETVETVETAGDRRDRSDRSDRDRDRFDRDYDRDPYHDDHYRAPYGVCVCVCVCIQAYRVFLDYVLSLNEHILSK